MQEMVLTLTVITRHASTLAGSVRRRFFVTIRTGLRYSTLHTGNEGRTEVNMDNLNYFHVLKCCAKINSIGFII